MGLERAHGRETSLQLVILFLEAGVVRSQVLVVCLRVAEHPIDIFDGAALEQAVLQMHEIVTCVLVGAQLSCRRKGEVCPILRAHRAPGVMTVGDVRQCGVYPPAVVITRARTTSLSARIITSSRGGR